MNTEQEREAFEAWYVPYLYTGPYPPASWTQRDEDGKYVERQAQVAFDAYRAGRATLQAQREIQFQVWRSTDSCMEFWSWDDVDQYDYDQAKPEDRRIIQIVKEG